VRTFGQHPSIASTLRFNAVPIPTALKALTIPVFVGSSEQVATVAKAGHD
jgi:hypothetical protein